MKENLKDILSGLSKDIDQQKLLEYLQGQLSPDQQHDLEEQILKDDFAADALEGLDAIKDKQKIQALVEQLNKDLEKKTAKKRAFRRKLQLRLDSTTVIAIVTILLLIVLSYFILHRLLHK